MVAPTALLWQLLTKGDLIGVIVKSVVGIGALVLAAIATADPSMGQSAKDLVTGDPAFALAASSGPNGEQDGRNLPLFTAIAKRDVEGVRQQLASGTSPNALLYPGAASPLIAAIILGEQDIVTVLADAGANLNYVGTHRGSESPLIAALTFGIENEELPIFHDLLNRGADVNAVGGVQGSVANHGKVASHAAILGRMDVVNELLARGYCRDMKGLLTVLKSRMVSEDRIKAKEQAIRTVTMRAGQDCR